MISIPQYETFLSVYISIAAIIPCIALCLTNKRSKVLNTLTSLVIIVSILGLQSIQFIEFVGFLVFETLIVLTYAYTRNRISSKKWYYFCFALSLLPILFVRSVVFLKPNAVSIIGFTGLSYMCFKVWQVIIELHDDKIQKVRILDLWNLILFFPSFSSGPIARFHEFLAEHERKRTRQEYVQDYLIGGIRDLMLGLFYKFALASLINTFWMSKVPEGFTFLNALSYGYAYTFYLFFDFAGYSKIAIGIGRMMGIALPENFNMPFLARNMKEFWARWHMSLSTWFNDYLFSRFVLNSVRSGVIKDMKTAARVSYMVTMTTMGLWHGFTLHYLIYGVYEGLLLVLSDIYVKTKHYRTMKKKPYYDWAARIATLQFIVVGMLIFSGRYF